jgi:hypothetical protein
MRLSRLVGVTALMSVLGTATLATSARIAPVRQWAVVYLETPTLIGSTIVQGPVLVSHDDARMARGEPCTTVQLFEPGKGPAETIAAFHCIRTNRPVASAFTVRTRPNLEDGLGCVLTEYQFAGDSDGHGVPPPVKAP